MGDGLLENLIREYSHHYQRLMNGEKPLVDSDRDRYFPNGMPPQMNPLEAWIFSLSGGTGYTSGLTGNIALNPNDINSEYPDDTLDTLAHENYHHRRHNMSMASNTALRNASVSAMGGEDEYQNFMKTLRPDNKYWLYKLQSMIPYFGNNRMEEEAMAYWIGASSVGHSRKSLKEALNKSNPKLWDLYNLHTNGINFLQER